MDYKMNNDFFDTFPVLFTKDGSKIAEQNNVLGYYATQALRMDTRILNKIDVAVLKFKEEFQVFLAARDASSAAIAQQELNHLWSLIGKLPAYDLLQKYDNRASYLIRYMRQHPDEVDDMLTIGTDRNRMMNEWLEKLDRLTEPLRLFIRNTAVMLDDFFEDLPSRKSEEYAKSYGSFRHMIYSAFNTEQENADDLSDAETLQFFYPVRLSYVTHTSKTGKVSLAERMHFEDLVSFLYVDFFKGMAVGNLPRRCQNCKKFFLALGAYDTLYCNEIAPGETKRTCRMVGAHKKEKLKTRSKPTLREYSRVYNRLKARKRNGLITTEQWNEQVSYIQDLKEKALKGILSEAQLKAIYDQI